MSDLSKRPVILAVVLLALVAAIAFGWTRTKALNGITKENSKAMTKEELIQSMSH